MIEDLAGAISAAQRRYERWLGEPESAYWHACKLILAYALMIYGGMPEGELRAYLLRCPWFDDFARHGFGIEPDGFIGPLLAEMLRSKAADWHNSRLVALGRHNPPPPGWAAHPIRPKNWPELPTYHGQD